MKRGIRGRGAVLRGCGAALLAFVMCVPAPSNAQDDSVDAAIDRYATVLAASPTDSMTLATLQEMASRASGLDAAHRVRIRDLLSRYPHPGHATLVARGEPGTPLVVAGTVRGADGTPLGAALLHVFHTDAQGHYTPAKSMDEPNARLFAWVRTDAEGRYTFRTIRPGGYPVTRLLGGKQRHIPAHVHYEVSAPGYVARQFQLVFDDDPHVAEDYWRNWAKEGGNPIAHAARNEDGVTHCVVDVTLEKR